MVSTSNYYSLVEVLIASWHETFSYSSNYLFLLIPQKCCISNLFICTFLLFIKFKCSGQKLRKLPLPSELDYPNAGEKISFMDVSYNKITCLDGLEFYPALETLILDCNQVGDVDFPYCPSMTSLSINKNQVLYTHLKFKLNKIT